MGVASKDVQIIILLVCQVFRSVRSVRSVRSSDEPDLIDFRLDRLSTNLPILFGEFTLSDSMINESTLNSFFRNSATFCVPIPNSLILLEPHCEHEVGTVY
jgi:hypothetical protein